MKPTSLSAASKYVAAFLSGYIGALLPILATGEIPCQKALIAALVPGLIATGLIHYPSPKQG